MEGEIYVQGKNSEGYVLKSKILFHPQCLTLLSQNGTLFSFSCVSWKHLGIVKLYTYIFLLSFKIN